MFGTCPPWWALAFAVSTEPEAAGENCGCPWAQRLLPSSSTRAAAASWAPMGAHLSWCSDIRYRSSLRHRTPSFISVLWEQLNKCLWGARHAHREGAELQDQEEEPAKSHTAQVPTNYFQPQSLHFLAMVLLMAEELPFAGVWGHSHRTHVTADTTAFLRIL